MQLCPGAKKQRIGMSSDSYWGRPVANHATMDRALTPTLALVSCKMGPMTKMMMMMVVGLCEDFMTYFVQSAYKGLGSRKQ